MLYSLALIFILGIVFAELVKKTTLPGLLGMIIVGIIIGPYCLNLLDSEVIKISAQLRKLALIIILTSAGLTINIQDLKQIGRPALLMSFVPACFEITGVTIIAPLFFNISHVEAALMGSVIAAVSPAVVVPRMLKLIKNKWGTNKKIPQLLIAGSSVDDIFDIVIFTALLSLVQKGTVNALVFAQIPISIVLGIALGVIVGMALNVFFNKVKLDHTIMVLITLSFSFVLVHIEELLKGTVPISGLLAIMSMGVSINQKSPRVADQLYKQYTSLWTAAQILLFVLVGTCVNISYALQAVGAGACILCFSLMSRMTGVATCVLKTKLTIKERLFCMVSYTPKATVQAAIGAVPLAMNLKCGQTILTIAVLSILMTAPLGALIIDKTYKKLLTQS